MNAKAPIFPTPQMAPQLDSDFIPLSLALRQFRSETATLKNAVPVRMASEQTDGSISHYSFPLFPDEHPGSAANFRLTERLVKFLLWARGGYRIYFDGPV